MPAALSVFSCHTSSLSSSPSLGVLQAQCYTTEYACSSLSILLLFKHISRCCNQSYFVSVFSFVWNIYMTFTLSLHKNALWHFPSICYISPVCAIDFSANHRKFFQKANSQFSNAVSSVHLTSSVKSHCFFSAKCLTNSLYNLLFHSTKKFPFEIQTHWVERRLSSISSLIGLDFVMCCKIDSCDVIVLGDTKELIHPKLKCSLFPVLENRRCKV